MLAKNFMEGQGTISILLGKINLAPGIYLLNIGVWDKDMLHPYVIRKKDVLKLGAKGLSKKTEVVFLPEIMWKIEN